MSYYAPIWRHPRRLILLLTLIVMSSYTDAQHNRSHDITLLHRTHRSYMLAHRKSCGQLALQLGVPQVAILFLTVADLPLNDAWIKWLTPVAGVLPAPALASACGFARPNLAAAFTEQHTAAELGPFHGNPLLVDELATSCQALTASPDTPVLYRQSLFNVYAHAPPDLADYAPDSLLFGRRIAQRVPSVRISHTLVTVERYLLREALQWSANSRFVFVSESHLPLYPAAAVYMQLMHEPRARIDACPPLASSDEVQWKTCSVMVCLQQQLFSQDTISFWRWKPELSPKDLWRKTSHWITMTRAVASVVLHERKVDAAFEAHCQDHCSNIEHYIPTMLAVHDLVHLTSCSRGTTYVDWSVKNDEGRPKTFAAEELSTGLLQHARVSPCDAEPWAAVDSALRGMVPVGLVGSGTCLAAKEAPEYAALEPQCPLFIRKVAGGAAATGAELVAGMVEEAPYRVAPQGARR